MQNKIISIGHINPDTDSVLSAILISRFSKNIFGAETQAAIAGAVNNETKFILNLLKIETPQLIQKITDEQVIMVDTTETPQIIGGLTESNIYAIIDHHNLGGLKSAKPILSRVEPIGCTASVIYKILKEKKVKIDRTSAILIMASIVSDTLNLTSPTTSADDKKILKELNKIAKLDLKKFVNEQFAAKSNLEGIRTEDITSKDYKQFDMGKSKVGIGVWETTDPETVNGKKEELMRSLAKQKQEEKLNYIFFMVVDILKEYSIMYLIGNDEAALTEKVFGGKPENGLLTLPGVVSRKKQIVPPLMNELIK